MSIQEAPAGMGHNNPPSPLEEHEAKLKARASALKDAAVVWIDERPSIEDQETSNKAADFIVQIRAFNKLCEDTRTELKKPHLDAGREIDKRLKAIPALLDTVGGILKKRVAEFQKKEQERIDAERRAKEEAERKAKEEAERLAREAEETESVAAIEAAQAAEEAAKQAEAERVAAPTRAMSKGNLGSKSVSIRKSYTAEITDYEKALAHYANSPQVRDAVLVAANADARTRKLDLDAPGVKVIEHTTAV